MSNNTVYSEQIFVRIKKGNTGYNEKDLEKDMKELMIADLILSGYRAGLVEIINQDRKIDEDVLRPYLNAKNRYMDIIKKMKQIDKDKDGYLHFWTLNSVNNRNLPVLPGKENCIVLSTIDGRHARYFSSIEDIYKEFLPLDTVLEDKNFVGKRIADEPIPIYMIYKYNNISILCFSYGKGKYVITPASFMSLGEKDMLDYIEPNEKLRGANKVKTEVYKMKKAFLRQID